MGEVSEEVIFTIEVLNFQVEYLYSDASVRYNAAHGPRGGKSLLPRILFIRALLAVINIHVITQGMNQTESTNKSFKLRTSVDGNGVTITSCLNLSGSHVRQDAGRDHIVHV